MENNKQALLDNNYIQEVWKKNTIHEVQVPSLKETRTIKAY